METRYTVRQAAELTGVKSYVMRYWEEELNLSIRRNELGHRYYTGYDIQLFLNIKELKKRGLQLRAIRELIPQIARIAPGAAGSKVKLLEGECLDGECPDRKRPGTGSWETRKAETAGVVFKEKTQEQQRQAQDDTDTGMPVPDTPEPDNPKILEFQAILERLIAQELQSQNEEEERCRSLDLAIRRQQLARREAAAASGDKKSSHSGKRERKDPH